MLVVADEAAAFHDPGEAALDDPAPFEDDEAREGRAAADDLEDDVGLGVGPFDEAPGIAAIGEYVFDEGEAAAGAAEDAFRTVAVLDVGTVNLNVEEAPVGIRQYVPLAPVDLFARIEPFESPF